jgi:hypothetical protein
MKIPEAGGMESVETSHQTLSKRPEYIHDCANGRCLSLSTSQLSDNASLTCAVHIKCPFWFVSWFLNRVLGQFYKTDPPKGVQIFYR